MSACPIKPGFDLPKQGILTDNTSLMPEAKLGPKNLQHEKVMEKKGGVHRNLPHRSLDQHRIQPNQASNRTTTSFAKSKTKAEQRSKKSSKQA